MENKENIKEGDTVILGSNVCGYKVGDVAIVKKVSIQGCHVFVEGRESTSSLRPLVSYHFNNVSLKKGIINNYEIY